MDAKTDELAVEIFDKEIKKISIDSRSVRAGELFFALSQKDYERAGFNGVFADGHEYVASAFASGALSAVVRSDHIAEMKPFRGRLLVVEDAIAALQIFAHRVY